MQAQIKAAAGGASPRFFYHLGDVVYFNGQSINYPSQFYEPYQYYDAPIFAIPGNHDGDTVTLKGDQPDAEPSLYGFMTNFCSPTPEFLFKHRQTMTKPYCYWKLEAPFVHIVGLYSNVDGLLDARGTAQQQNWLIEQIKAIPADKWFILAVHHPCYSLDSAHGGYEETLEVAVPYQTTCGGVSLEYFDVENSGFLRFTAAPNALRIDYFSVSFDDPPRISDEPADTVSIEVPNSRRKTA